MSNATPMTPSANAADSHYPLRLLERISYGAGDFGCSMYWVVFAQYLMYFYTDVAGLPVAAVSTMLLVSRLWDTINDPMMGLIADRTKSRHGRYRPWLIWMILPLVISGVLVFTIPDISAKGKLIYAYITYNLVGMVYTSINLPFAALMGVMSSNEKERTILASFRYIGSNLGNLIPQLTIFAIVGFFGANHLQAGYAAAMVCYGLLAAVLLWVAFRNTTERVAVPASVGSGSVASDVGMLLKNIPWVILAVVGLLTLVWISIRFAATVYYFKYNVGDETLASTFFALGTVGMMAGIACTKWVVQLVGDKRRAYMLANILAALSIGCFYFVETGDVFVMFAVQLLTSLLIGPILPLMYSLFADSADYGEWKFNKRTTGLIFAAGSASNKMGWTFGGSFGGYLLAWYGYQANVVQNEATLYCIRSLMSWIPALAALLSAVIIYFYPITDVKMREISADLALRRAKRNN
jgi:GPH family glycoside/pentoside/hexuronide:cation symporter